MKSLFITFLAFTFSLSYSNAQMILNAESLRVNMLKNKEHWSGSVGLSFSYTKNTTDIYNISSNLALGYNGGENLWMIISNINFNKAESVAFQNSGVQHLRYNRQTNRNVTFEAFLQGQYDEVFAIKFRSLAGVGARFELFKNKKEVTDNTEDNKSKSRIFIGSLAMYEYEKASEIENNKIRRNFRSSNYLTFSLYPTDQVTIISTTYYQPRFDKLKDYRLSSEIGIRVGFSSIKEADKKSFWDKLEMNLSFNYNYDAFPVLTIPKRQYNISNGLIYNL